MFLAQSRRSFIVIVGFALFLQWFVWTAPADAQIDAATVQQSIDRGVAYLRKSRTDRGGWSEYGGQSCGLTALCTLSMLNAGVPSDDPDVSESLRYLRQFAPEETYSVALQTLVFCYVGAAADLPRIRRNVDWLEANQMDADSPRPGAWNYGGVRGGGDPSNAQFAILALGAAVDRGVAVDVDVLQLAAEYWRASQLRRGGWSYGGPRASGSMTCAGIASLIIIRSALPSEVAEPLTCCGTDESDEDAIARGLDYLGNIFSLRANPGGELLSYYYYLYAVERVGRLSGRRLIGGRDWYREGAETLVARQDGFQGFWQGDGAIESNRDIATAFALLFLAKGKRQVVVGRLQHPSLSQRAVRVGGVQVRQGAVADQPDASMSHPNALRHLVRHVQQAWGRDLTWQTVDGTRASAADLLQTPVLVIAGRTSLQFEPGLRDSLKEYLDQGGTILFDAQAGDGCGDAGGFQSSVLELCRQWYPGAAMERLPPSHPVWFAEKPADPTAIGEDFWMYGLGACCRTPVFYSPRSLTCRWALSDRLLVRAPIPAGIRRSVTASVSLGENVIAYATGRELKDKLEASEMLDAAEPPPPTRAAIPMAVGALGAGERQVQRALPNAAGLIRDKLAVEVIAVDQPIALTDESLRRVGALYLHGQTGFQLDEPSRLALRRYLERGGILLAAPICGSEEFGDSFRQEMKLVLPSVEWEPMSPDHPAFTPRFGGYDLTEVTIRTPARRGGGDRGTDGTLLADDAAAPAERPGVAGRGPLQFAQRRGSPLIEVAQVDGVDSVFYSPLDLSCALESQNSVQCPGYPTVDAAQIVAGLLLYALQQ